MIKRDWEQDLVNMAGLPIIANRKYPRGFKALIAAPVVALGLMTTFNPKYDENLEQKVESQIEYIEPEIETPLDPYRQDPGVYQEGEPEAVTLARLMYAEARSEHDNVKVLEHKGSSVLNRMKNRDQTLEEAIFAPHQYTCFKDGNKSYFYNPSKFMEKSEIDKKAWEIIYDISEDLIENGPKYKTTHTWMEFKDGKYHGKPQEKPTWADHEEYELIESIPTSKGVYHQFEGI